MLGNWHCLRGKCSFSRDTIGENVLIFFGKTFTPVRWQTPPWLCAFLDVNHFIIFFSYQNNENHLVNFTSVRRANDWYLLHPGYYTSVYKLYSNLRKQVLILVQVQCMRCPYGFPSRRHAIIKTHSSVILLRSSGIWAPPNKDTHIHTHSQTNTHTHIYI